MSFSPPYIAIIGATGSGKSKLAFELAKALPGEIIGCDSIQLYRGFNIGSAKPNLEERKEIPHHLVDILDAHESYDAWQYRKAAREAIKAIFSRGKVPLVVGGTGLYLRALMGDNFHSLPHNSLLKEKLSEEKTPDLYDKLKALNPKRSSEIHPHDRYRVIRALEIHYLQESNALIPPPDKEVEDPWLPSLTIMLDPPRNKLHSRIAQRTKKLLEVGLVEETRSLLKTGVSPTSKGMLSIGYKQVVLHDKGLISKEELCQKIIEATRQYAKRQLTWFKKHRVDLRIHGEYKLEEVIGLILSQLSN